MRKKWERILSKYNKKMADRSNRVEVSNLSEITDNFTLQSNAQATLDHGSNLDVDTSAEQMTATSFAAVNGVLVMADSTNTGIIYVGNSDVTAGNTAGTDGIPLVAGASAVIPINNPNKIYVIASAENQKIYWLAV